MFTINNDKSIYITRGDIASISVGAKTNNGVNYTFVPGDIVRLRVFKRKDCQSVMLQKDVVIEENTEVVIIDLNREDTKIGDLINRPTDYWYEVELNPDTMPQTIIGYDSDGAKIFRLYPEGADSK